MFMGLQFSKWFLLQLQVEMENVCSTLITSSDPEQHFEDGLIEQCKVTAASSWFEKFWYLGKSGVTETGKLAQGKKV